MEVAPEKIGAPVSARREKVRQPWSHLFTQSVTRMIILGCTQKKTCIMGDRTEELNI